MDKFTSDLERTIADSDIHPLHAALPLIAQKKQPRAYLEIGVRDGKSLALVWAAARQCLNTIVVCDTWGSSYGGTNHLNHLHIAAMAEREGFANIITYLDGNSRVLIPALKQQKKFDLITIDGDHSYEGCYADLENCLPLLTYQGFIVVDDITHPAHTYLTQCVKDFAADTKAVLFFINHIALLSRPADPRLITKDLGEIP